ncbi:ABC transporter permease [Halonotius pteroides]|uniref:ABC transporter permease n=1 Tax=Halonotius pteroides TaxID=268735 RepID=A0A3A6Q296_9EURY|nr:ABC transporter permease [Halonotius pteroides]RJX51051.1 ABC transporter permease [Halonotius pteroides]
MGNTDRALRWLFRAGYGTVFLLLVAPVVVVTATSLSATTAVTFPPTDLSFRWYTTLFTRRVWMQAVQNSLLTAGGTAVFSTGLGVAGALGARHLSDRSQIAVSGLVLVPLLVPGVVLGVSLLIFFSRFGLQQRLSTIVLAHALWATPLTFSVMRATFSRFDWQLQEAAMDLGASRLRAFREVVVPNTVSGLVAAAAIAFVVSLQEFIMALFLSGRETRTIPVESWFALRGSLSPLVSVASTLLVGAVVLTLIIAATAIGLERVADDT